MKLIDLHKEIDEKQIAKVDSNLESSVGILKVKMGKLVLAQREKFDFLKYLIHYRGLEEHMLELLNQNVETNHYAYDTKVIARFSMKQVERLKILFNEKMKLKDFTFLGIATNSKGIGIQSFDTTTMVKTMKEMDINKGEFYLFYPLRK